MLINRFKPIISRDVDGVAAGATGTPAAQTGDQNQGGNTPKPVEFSSEQQAKLQELMDASYARGAGKAEKEWSKKFADLEARIPGAKPAEPKPKDVEKTYSQTEVQELLQESLKEPESKTKAAEARIGQLLEKDRTSAIVTAAARAKAIDPEDIATLAGRFVAHDEDGALVVLNEKGQPRLNAKGEPMTVDEFVKQFVDSKPHLKQGTGIAGAGSGSGNGVSKGATPTRAKSFDDAANQFAKALAGGGS